MDKKIIIGVGEILWDVYADHRKMGGAPANFAYNMSRLGYDAYVVSAVGDDLLGDEIINRLDELKISHYIEKVDYPTGTVDVLLDDNGVPTYHIQENVAWDNIVANDQVRAIAANASAICFGSLAQRSIITRETIQQLLTTVPASAIRIFDINLRQNFYDKEMLEDSLYLANVLKINAEELQIVTDMFNCSGDTSQRIAYLMKVFGLKTVIYTNGSIDSMIVTPEQTSHLLTPVVEVVDTVGAGDAFTAAFVAARLHGKSISVSHKFAVEMAALVCTQPGAMVQFPSWLKKSLDEL